MIQLSRIKMCKKMSFMQILKMSKRYLCVPTIGNSGYVIEKLQQRGLLRISGKDSSDFLQGLITNDMRHVEEGSPCMYTMFLNTRGRVLHDAIIYRTERKELLVETDAAALPALKKHLQLYRVRRKIDVDIVDNVFKMWVIFSLQNHMDPGKVNNGGTILEGQIVSQGGSMNITESETDTTFTKLLKDRDGIIVCRDPRLAALGHRIVAPVTEDFSNIGKSMLPVNHMNYRALRYKLGVGEGTDDLPPGNCFPLEANGDYLHGVSFHKGCYIGQELTARTHHTGVVRKRLMPVVLETHPSASFVQNAPIQTDPERKTSVGKLRGLEQMYGLGLLRINEALAAPALKVLNVSGKTGKPSWWPKEAPKERSATAKES